MVDTRQLKDPEFLAGLFELADQYKAAVAQHRAARPHEGRIVASFFYQPSTRTKLSFDAAAKRLGAEVIGTENAREFSSAYKGETLAHSLRATEEFADVFVLRHDRSFAALEAARTIAKPVINAGDGTNQHPTQALLDHYTISRHFGRTDDLRVAFVGDAERGRTVRSLAYLLAHGSGNRITFVSPAGTVPEDMRRYLREKDGVTMDETVDLEAVLPDVDVLYVTRLQWEYADAADQARLKESYHRFQVRREHADRMQRESIILHPLPINTEKSDGFPEIAPGVDGHPRARYFKQSNNGLYVRMALLDVLLTGPEHPLYGRIGPLPEAGT